MYSVGINGIRFNQETSCFSIAMDQGAKIYNIHPFRQKLVLPHEHVGSLVVCEMLYRTNLLALVGGGSIPKYADNTVLIWDDCLKKFIFEVTFDMPVKGVRLRRDKMAVIMRNNIHIFTFPNKPEKMATFETGDNARGLCAFSTSTGNQIIAIPGKNAGSVQIIDLKEKVGTSSHSRSPQILLAHKTALACLVLNSDSSLLATASKRGTLIRIYSTSDLSPLVELRRGMEHARLYSLAFSPDSEMLVASSDKGTCHIFAVKQTEINRRMPIVPRSISNLLKSSIAETQWGFGQFQLPAEIPAVVGFVTPQEIVALTFDGKYYKYVLTSAPVSGKTSKPGIGSPQVQCSEYDMFVNYEDEEWLKRLS